MAELGDTLTTMMAHLQQILEYLTVVVNDHNRQQYSLEFSDVLLQANHALLGMAGVHFVHYLPQVVQAVLLLNQLMVLLNIVDDPDNEGSLADTVVIGSDAEDEELEVYDHVAEVDLTYYGFPTPEESEEE